MKQQAFEHYSQPVLSTRHFLARIAKHGGIALAFLVFSLGMGMSGYHYICGLAWLDSFLNASMILTGMGPLAVMTTSPQKLFAGCYALYSGIAFLGAIGILFAPFFHRIMHKLHLGK